MKLAPRISFTTRVVLWLIGLPLLMAALGAWTFYANRADAFLPSAQEQAQIEQLEGILDKIQGDPYASISVNGKSYGNPVATKMVRDRIAQLRHTGGSAAETLALAPVMRTVGLATLVSGMAAALIGVAGMAMVRQAASRARRSREQLLAAFSWWQRWLGRYIGLLLLVLSAGFLALTVIACMVAYERGIIGNASGGELKLYVFMVFIGAFLAWGCLRALWRLRASLATQHEPMAVMGRDMSEAEAPGLWRYVRDLAERVGTAAPDHIVLGVVSSFYVTAHDIMLQPHGKPLTGRTLHLPLSYMILLSPEENTAVLAHELGHFVGADTDYSLRFLPIYAGMYGVFDKVVERSDNEWATPALAFTGYLVKAFDQAVQHWSRLREFEADRIAASVAGGQAVAASLIRVTALDQVVNRYLAEISRRPDAAGEDFIGRLSDAARDTPLSAPDLSAEVATAHPHDTHPPTLERITAVGITPTASQLAQVLAEPVNPAHQTWVRDLFSDSDAVQRAVLEDFKAVARETNAAQHQALTALAEQGKGEVSFLHSNKMLWVVGFLLVIVLILLGGSTFLGAHTGFSGGETWISLGAAAAGLILIVCLVMLIKGRKRPFLTLADDAIRVPGLVRAVPWADVENFEMSVIQGNILITFILRENAPDYGKAPGYVHGFKYQPAKGKMLVSGRGVRGMKPQQLFDLLSEYQAAAAARNALRTW